jgi:hypothetical protein
MRTPDQPPAPRQAEQAADGVTLRGEVERVLRENGLSDEPGKYDSSIHSWRCDFPDIYGQCSCFAELADELVALLAATTERTAP